MSVKDLHGSDARLLCTAILLFCEEIGTKGTDMNYRFLEELLQDDNSKHSAEGRLFSMLCRGCQL